ncbi:16S rRNA (uracil(1498)-N(3))-methyltransferase [uncultured Thermanaerothrix sp.]|uniref:16S rRNA (uracil(1498)-N(3))-methyltransferase n=1 Tax=uncultured Thermanaerothrix sp. TaxID=1195149 RepID=UPI00260A1AE2|nr:16S rRNA (uracil(1498)-N(3))-methyltransferase [uncultured Thermanaerothrix sp.]
MHRFFLPPDCIHASWVSFPPETAHQIYAVLRMKTGQEVVVLDNNGAAFRVRLENLQPSSATGVILETLPITSEPRTRLTLYLGLTQREKFEWVLQKGTEVGIIAFVPLITQRTLVREITVAREKLPRWRRIVQEAAEQCGRGRIPEVHPPLELERAIKQAQTTTSLCLMAWEGENQRSLRQAIRSLSMSPEEVALIIGPEGGLSPNEVLRAQQAGWLTCSLGTRILRMETAAILGAALTLYELNDL